MSFDETEKEETPDTLDSRYNHIFDISLYEFFVNVRRVCFDMASYHRNAGISSYLSIWRFGTDRNVRSMEWEK